MEGNLKERLIATLLKTILFFAFVHILLLVAYSIIAKKIEAVNIFNILNLNFFFLNIGYGAVSQVLSALVIVAVTLVIFLFFSE